MWKSLTPTVYEYFKTTTTPSQSSDVNESVFKRKLENIDPNLTSKSLKEEKRIKDESQNLEKYDIKASSRSECVQILHKTYGINARKSLKQDCKWKDSSQIGYLCKDCDNFRLY